MTTISKLIKEKILVLDGATGTSLQKLNLTAKDFGGEKFEGCNEILVVTRPDVIENVHREYLEAGCDIIETNSFGGTPLVLAEYDLADRCYELNFQSAKIARQIADQYTNKNPTKPRFVAGSMGPTTKALSVTGGISFYELSDHFYQQAKGLFDGGVDYFLIETANDTLNVKACVIGLKKLFEEKGQSKPIAISGTIEATGTMLAGQNAEALIISLSHLDLLYIGINCATGPDMMTGHIRSLHELSPFPVACAPNAGLPDANGKYLESPQMFSETLGRFLNAGWLNVVGGCCGTTPAHIKELALIANKFKPRSTKNRKGSYLSGIEILEVTDEKRPIQVGERTNVIGSKKFKELIYDEKFDEAAEIAKSQVKKGAEVIDVCLSNPDRNELSDMKSFMEKVIHKIKAPIMIDSIDNKVVELALTYCQGKAIINSINLEDGEERFNKVVPLAKTFGAALVIGTIDEDPTQGMAVKRERKLEIAQRSYNILTNNFGFPVEDMYFDPLVFPCATGDQNYIGSAKETIEGIRLIKEKIPGAKTAIGLSNVSFGLPQSGREVINSVFLYHCTLAGLDLAIVNSEKLKRYSTLSKEEIQMAEDILFNTNEEVIKKFTDHFRSVKNTATKITTNLTTSEQVSRAVVEGFKEGLVENLEILRQTMEPLSIINGPLMDGMREVGVLFNANKLIVAEVLQSAEVMKAAVGHLQQFMSKNETFTKGKFLLATVKGDVHDIGKNLVDIVLTNNGYDVINLGIKITSEQLIQACKEHSPDFIGLSGLLVKSALQMAISAEDLKNAGISVPLLVGGAALSKNFTDDKIAPNYQGNVYYAKDAMTGLEICNKIVQ